MVKMLDITAPKYPVEIAIHYEGSVLWVNVDGKCVLRICQIPALILNDYRNAQARELNKKKLKHLTLKGET